ncbi:hypothetical protein IV500_18510 [Paeniglutamicibacter antarcticus]|uniref:Uncharacterized protein n=1 Tax=Arthrobacter terrae TaxID=2935737 RepID=A0A931G9Q1_9MICC|nr:hypothetical protein [Arthrobacter terrae]MBG0741359.1 hypothetical protein [Arthrobacter terrae]
MGEGIVQICREQDRAQNAVNLIATGYVPEIGWKHGLPTAVFVGDLHQAVQCSR